MGIVERFASGRETKPTPKYKPGDRVILHAMPENDVYEETGTIQGPEMAHLDERGNIDAISEMDAVSVEYKSMGWEIMYIVKVDPIYMEGPLDDGFREVTEDQIAGFAN